MNKPVPYYVPPKEGSLSNGQPDGPHAPYFIAVYGGFLVVESYEDNDQKLRTKVYTVSNFRHATPWPNFESADGAAKWAVATLYPPDLRYFGILSPAFV